MTYVVTVNFGYYEDNETIVIYAGRSRTKAAKLAQTYQLDDLKYTYLQTWARGKMIEEKGFSFC